MLTTEDSAYAFNQGCDARLAGTKVDLDPYESTDPMLSAAWRRGWFDVHYFWGKQAPYAKPLPYIA